MLLTNKSKRLRTFHYYFRIIHKTMHHAQGLYNRYPSLVLSQAVQSLEDCLDFGLSQMFLCKLLYGTLSDGQFNMNDT
jgi:hypothetical protein